MPRFVRTSVAVSLCGGLLAVGAALSPPAGASAEILINAKVNATTTLATLKQSVTIPQGTFSGQVSDTSGKMTGTLRLPPASTTVTLAGVGLATATFKVAPTKKVTGSLNSSLTLTAKTVFNIDVTSVKPAGLPINLVGSQCMTSTPITLTLSGPLSVLGSSTFSGTYTIPKLMHCEALTAALDLVLSGKGNTMKATFTPD